MKKHSNWLVFSLAIAVLCLFGVYAAVNGQRMNTPPETPASLPDNTGTYRISTITTRTINTDASSDTIATSTIVIGTTNTDTANSVATGTVNTGTTNSIIPSQTDTHVPQPTLLCKYYTEKDFMASVSAVKDSDIPFPDDIVGGIVPHHLLAGKMIATFFKTLSKSAPETLIILAPNHRRIGHNSMNTSVLDWNTPYGILKSDPLLTNRLISELNISEDNTLMEEEYSISSLVPYIKYYMPDTKIVPILLHGSCTASEASELGRRLSGKFFDAISTSGSSGSAGTALIASVDFSHYLDANTADKMDEKTLKAIKAFDIQSISRMGNDNLDSPPSIIALLSAMMEAGTDAPEVTGHDNSSNITGKGLDYTTSYFTMFFRYPSK